MNRAEQRERTSELVNQLHDVARGGVKRILAVLEAGGVLDAEGKFRQLNAIELNAITGTAVDKISKYENWEKKGVGEAGDWVRALVSGLQQAGGVKVSLEVEATPVRVETKVIDVPVVAGVIEATYAVERRANATAEELAHIREMDRQKQQRARDRKRAARGVDAG